MSPLSRREFLGGMAATMLATTGGDTQAAQENKAYVPQLHELLALNCETGGRIFDTLRRNSVLINTIFPDAEGPSHGSGTILRVPEQERGPKYDPAKMYILACRHSMAKVVEEDNHEVFCDRLGIYVRSDPDSVRKERLHCINYDIDVSTPTISNCPDLALLACEKGKGIHPDGLSLHDGNPALHKGECILKVGRMRSNMTPAVSDGQIISLRPPFVPQVYSGTLNALCMDPPIVAGNSGGAIVSHTCIRQKDGPTTVMPRITGVIFGNLLVSDKRTPLHALAVPYSQIRSFLCDIGILDKQTAQRKLLALGDAAK